MSIKTILIPQAVAEICYLSEALMWVAINRFPLGALIEEGYDARRELDYIEGLDPNFGDDSPVTDAECARVGLSVNPTYGAGISGDAHRAPEDLKNLLSADGLRDDNRQWLERELAESVAFNEACKRWDEEFKDFVDVHSSRLFLALREGRLVAEGIKLPESSREASLIRLDEMNWTGWGLSKWVSIPSDFWHSNKINWEKSWAEGRGAAFALIQVKADGLFACFPPPAPEAANVVKVANDLVPLEQTGDEPGTPNLRGRPPLNWDSFHLELAKRINSNALPEKQEALVAEMQAWCKRNWRRDVGRSTVLQKIKPYYDLLVRRPNDDG
jgi:hypothetical protein